MNQAIKREVTAVREVVESHHPYENSSNTTHTIAIEGATQYKLIFDSQCVTEESYDYLELFLDESKEEQHLRWEGENWPTEPVEIEVSALYFHFTSDDSTNFWGYKITVESQVEREVNKAIWLEQLKESMGYLILILNKNMIKGNFNKTEADLADVDAILSSPLIRYGIKDKSLWLISPDGDRSLPNELVKVALFEPEIAKPQPEGSDSVVPALGKAFSSMEGIKAAVSRSISRFATTESASDSLLTYITQFAVATQSVSKFSEDQILDEFITGSEKAIAAMTELKKKAGAVGPFASIGGPALDQAERAILAVYIYMLNQTDHFVTVLDAPESADPTTVKLVKTISQIRKWAQDEKSRRYDSGEESVTSAVINTELVQKCVLLLHSRAQRAVEEMQLKKVYAGVGGSALKRSPSEEEKSGALSTIKEAALWSSLKKQLSALGKLHTLRQFLPKQTGKQATETEDAEISRLNATLMEFLGSPVTANQLVTQLHQRRISAVCRAIGQNYLLNLMKSSLADRASVRSLGCMMFSEAFKRNGTRVHYTAGIEGVDTSLTR